MADLQEVGEANWETEVVGSEQPVLVDFWAPWCGPCRMLTPTVEAVAQELSGKLKVVKCNIDDNQAVAMRYNVMQIPMLVVFKRGKIADQIIGAGHSKAKLVERLTAKLA